MTDTTESNNETNETPDAPTAPETSFGLASLSPALQNAAARLGWTELMPVQQQTIPHMLDGLDVMVQSQTGSGKTGAFLLPALHRIDPSLGAVQGLVLAPTRELAVQVSREAEELGRAMGIRALPIYGGVGYKAQLDGLENGAQLVIGTPGRILDHLLKGNFDLDRLKVLVFDEADRMLSMGFYPDMKQLQRYLPRGLQSAMFSATYPGHVKRLAQQFLKDPVFVSLSQDQVHASDVLHVVYKVPAMQKSRVLVKIIEQENPASAIIFCNTKADVHFVAVVLRRFGYDVGEISADLTQGAREEVLDKLRRGKLRFLVATDVAARGIDIHELSHVLQYQPPQDHEAYVHRTGRTGRAGAAGVAISFVSGMEEIELEQIAKKFAIPLQERPIPADEDLETLITQRAVFLLEARLRQADNIQKERLQRFQRTVGELAANEDSRALLAMLVDEFYQSTFHAPLEQPSDKMPLRALPGQARRDQAADSESAAGQTNGARSEDGRSEEEKRKRKRRKNSGSAHANGQSNGQPKQANGLPGGQPDGPQPESLPEAEAPEAATQDQPGTGDQPASPAKKRRRRRPRKPGEARAEGESRPDASSAPEGSGASPEAGRPDKPAPEAGQPKKAQQNGAGAPEAAESRKPASEGQSKKPTPEAGQPKKAQPDGSEQKKQAPSAKNRNSSERGTAKGGAPATPAAKPRKKIFLE